MLSVPTFEGAPSKLCLGGEFDVQSSQTQSQLGLARALQSLKQGVARRLALRAVDSFWQARYYNFNVWSEKKFVEKLRYIHRNPVRRGLVARPEDLVWSSFRHYATGETSAVEIESQWTARLREQAGVFLTLRMRSAEENPRPSEAWTGHPRK